MKNGGAKGVKIDRCRIMPVRIAKSEDAATLRDVVNGVRWATQHGATIIHIGFGCRADGIQLRDAIADAIGSGIAVVVPVGNRGALSGLSASQYPDVIGVGAVDGKARRAPFSNRGLGLAVCAPGTDIRTPTLGGATRVSEGTSIASAFTAGVVGLIQSVAPQSSPRVIKEWLAGSAMLGNGTSWDPEVGFGVVDPSRVIQLARRRSQTCKASQPTLAVGSSTAMRVIRTTPEDPAPGQQVRVLIGLQNIDPSRRSPARVSLSVDGQVTDSASTASSGIGPGEEAALPLTWTVPQDGSRRYFVELRLEGTATRRLQVVKVASVPVHRVEIEGGQTARDAEGRTRVVLWLRNSGCFPEQNVSVRLSSDADTEEGACAKLESIAPGELVDVHLAPSSTRWFSDGSVVYVSVDPVPGQLDVSRTTGLFTVAALSGRSTAQWQSGGPYTAPPDQAHKYFSAEARKIYTTQGLSANALYVDQATNDPTFQIGGVEYHGEDYTDDGGDLVCKADRTLDHYWIAFRGDTAGQYKYEWAFGYTTVAHTACRGIRIGFLRWICRAFTFWLYYPTIHTRTIAYPSAFQKGMDLFWNNSVPNYRAGNFPLAYHYAGRVEHLLADMGVPAHAHGAPHGFDQGGFLYECGLSGVPCTFSWGSGSDTDRIYFYISAGGSDDVEAVGSVWSHRFSVDSPLDPTYQIPNSILGGNTLRDIFLSLWSIGQSNFCDSPPHSGPGTLWAPPVCLRAAGFLPLWGGRDYYTSDTRSGWWSPPSAYNNASDIVHQTVPATVRAIAGFYKFFRDTVKPGDPVMSTITTECGVNIVGAKPTTTAGSGVGVAKVLLSYSLDSGATWAVARMTGNGVVGTPSPGGVYQVYFDATGLADGANVMFRAQVVDTGGTDGDFAASVVPISSAPCGISLVNLPSPCANSAGMLTAIDSVFSPNPPYQLQAARIEGQFGYSTGDAHASLQYDSGNWTCQSAVPPGCSPFFVRSLSLLDDKAGFATGDDACGIWAWPITNGSYGGAAVQLADRNLYPGYSGAGVALIRGTSEGWSVDSDLFFHYNGSSWAPATHAQCLFCCEPPPPCPGAACAAEWENISFTRNDPYNGWATTVGALAEYSNSTGTLAWTRLVSPSELPLYNQSILTGVAVNSKTDKWVCGFLANQMQDQTKPLIARSSAVGANPTPVALPSLPGAYSSPALMPLLFDVTFYEPDVIQGLIPRGIAVGALFRPSPGTAPVIAFFRGSGQQNWTPLVLDVSPLVNPTIIKVRFVDAYRAYAIGWAQDASGVVVPLLIKISI